MKIYSFMKYKEEQTKPARFGAGFHGECWYKCPWCNKAFEFYDTQFERGFQKIDDKLYRHNECGKLVTVI